MRKPIIRVQLIRKRIGLINEIVKDSGNDVQKLLQDEKVLRPAVLMHLVAIAEQISKLKDENAFEILEQFSKDDLKGIGDIRNFIAHDYEGVDLLIVKSTIEQGIPSLEKAVLRILQP